MSVVEPVLPRRSVHWCGIAPPMLTRLRQHTWLEGHPRLRINHPPCRRFIIVPAVLIVVVRSNRQPDSQPKRALHAHEARVGRQLQHHAVNALDAEIRNVWPFRCWRVPPVYTETRRRVVLGMRFLKHDLKVRLYRDGPSSMGPKVRTPPDAFASMIGGERRLIAELHGKAQQTYEA